jgi:16S rRNA (adenine1518-N6/adenine1519-N6)-dimethyltransferase
MARVRQTQSYLRELFLQKGLAPRHKMGQHFLIDLNLHELIVNTAHVGPGDVILEVGTGAGAMTCLMAERGASVIAVELDPGMAQLTREAVSALEQGESQLQGNVQVLNIDALATKSTLNPLLVEAVESALRSGPGRQLKLVANLPYNVATPIITNLLVHPSICPTLLVATIQRELAERMKASPGSPDYGSLSVIVQALAEVEIVRILPPSVFWPRPKVESAIVAIRADPARRAGFDVPWFHAVVRKVFLHRRKNLRHVLAAMWPQRWSKHDVDLWLQDLGFDGQQRAETLDVGQFHTLADALQRKWPGGFGEDAGEG